MKTAFVVYFIFCLALKIWGSIDLRITSGGFHDVYGEWCTDEDFMDRVGIRLGLWLAATIILGIIVVVLECE